VARRLGTAALLHLDVGGTTAKCSLVLDGQPRLNADYRIEWSRLSPGYPIQTPVVDIVEIGAGGGSIVRVGPDGTIEVGPDSAGADPGPACYGRGHGVATITDAKLLTGVLDPDRFASRLRLDVGAAERAFAPLAERCGLPVAAVAEAAIRVAEHRMMSALKLVTVQRGHDPRDMDLLVTGGGGPMHAAALGRELGVARTLIPPMPGLFSAFGMLATPPRVDVSRTVLAAADEAGIAAARAVFDELERDASARFAAAGGDAATGPLAFRRGVEMRYRGQEHTVMVDWPAEPVTVSRLLAAFGDAHERAYTFRLDGIAVELVTYEVAAVQPSAWTPAAAPPAATHAAPRGARAVLTEFGMVSARVFDRDALPMERVEHGPALIEEATSTTLVLPGQGFTIDATGCLIIRELG
jgi:N-methylhydantoinase A